MACCNLLSACVRLVDELRRSLAVGILSTKGKKLIIFFFLPLSLSLPPLSLSLSPTSLAFFCTLSVFFAAAAVAVFVTCPTAPLGYYPWCGSSSALKFSVLSSSGSDCCCCCCCHRVPSARFGSQFIELLIVALPSALARCER